MNILNLKNYCKFIWAVDGLTWGLSMRIVVMEKKGCEKKQQGSRRNLFGGKSPGVALSQVSRGKMEYGTEFGAP